METEQWTWKNVSSSGEEISFFTKIKFRLKKKKLAKTQESGNHDYTMYCDFYFYKSKEIVWNETIKTIHCFDVKMEKHAKVIKK